MKYLHKIIIYIPVLFSIIVLFPSHSLSAPSLSETIVFIIEKLPEYGVVPFSNEVVKEKIKIGIGLNGKLTLEDDRWSEFHGYGNRVRIHLFLQHVKVVTTSDDFGGIIFKCRNNKKCIKKWYYGTEGIEPTATILKKESSSTIYIFDKQERIKLVKAFNYLITSLPKINDYKEDKKEKVERFFEKDQQ